MKNYIALICTIEDFGWTNDENSVEEELLEAHLEEKPWIYSYDIEVPEDTSEEHITLIARGIFWENDWSMNGTVSTVIAYTDAEENTTDDDEDLDGSEVDPQEADPDPEFIDQEESDFTYQVEIS